MEGKDGELGAGEPKTAVAEDEQQPKPPNAEVLYSAMALRGNDQILLSSGPTCSS